MKTLILTDEECELLSLVISDWLDWKKGQHNKASATLDALDRFLGDFKCSESTLQSFQKTKDAKQKSEQTIRRGESIALKLKTLSTSN